LGSISAATWDASSSRSGLDSPAANRKQRSLDLWTQRHLTVQPSDIVITRSVPIKGLAALSLQRDGSKESHPLDCGNSHHCGSPDRAFGL